MSEQSRQPGPGIEPAGFKPPVIGRQPRGARRLSLRPLPLALTAGALLLLAAAWFLASARAITLEFNPVADRVTIESGFAPVIGGRWLLRPGQYRLSAEAAGYHRIEEAITVGGEGGDVFRFEFRPLPGRLRILTDPAGAEVEVDGGSVGHAPMEALSLEPGEHRIGLRAGRHQVHDQSVDIDGRDQLQTLEVTLIPAWAAIAVNSLPTGASLRVDGEDVGVTPLTAEIGAGSHRLELRLDGYEPWRGALEVEANQPQTLSTVELAEARGRLQVSSDPDGASVAVAGSFVGSTPVMVALPPDRPTEVKVSKAGYQPVTRSLTIASGVEDRMALKLEPILGEVRVKASPEDAELQVDGEPRGGANQTLSLIAVPHVLTVSKSGYDTHETTVTPKPGLLQEVEISLISQDEAQARKVPARVGSAVGQTLVRVPPGRFTMGAPRREQGRRSNELQRKVELSRAFYMSAHEVSNVQFREFRPDHSSGIVTRTSLDVGNYPVVRVSWEDAVAYCNWLSQRDGLPPAYRGGELVQPVTTGYRLPSEAEWEWAARFAGGRNLKYPWGDAMPPTGAAGNFADASAAALVSDTLDSYDDTYPTAAPVGRFQADALGIFDLGGNVSEWVHDRYAAALLPGAAIERDPFGPGSGPARVVRGSSWRHGRITELRLSWRDSEAGSRDDLGFRIVRYVE